MSHGKDKRLSDTEADTAHARSCSCGDRTEHESKDGSDYSIPRDDESERK